MRALVEIVRFRSVSAFLLTLSILSCLMPSMVLAQELTLEAGTMSLTLDPQQESFLEIPQRELQTILCPNDPPSPYPPKISSIVIRTNMYRRAPLMSGVTDVSLRVGQTQWSIEEVRQRVPIQPNRFCLEASQIIETPCGGWNLSASLDDDATQPTSELQLDRLRGEVSGEFHGDLEANLRLRFSHREEPGRTVEMPMQARLRAVGQWTAEPGEGAVIEEHPFLLDTDCDQYEDTWVEPTAGLHLGWASSDRAGEVRTEPFCVSGEQGSAWFCLSPFTREAP